jgi:hypothetical protein
MLRGGLLALGVLLAGCAPSRWLVVRVRSSDGAPLRDATVSAVCEPNGSAAKLTGADGSVALEIRNYNPDRCVITATREGYDTQQTSGDIVCEDRSTCRPLDLRMDTE